MKPLLMFIEIAAIFAASISGGLEARRKQMDLVGVYFVAMATALAGGTMRDTLLGRFPVFWVRDAAYPLYVLAASLLVVALYKKSVLERPHVVVLVTVFDAIGLGLFSMVGVAIALEFNCPFFSAVLIGVVNGIVGGVLRDVLCVQIPTVFRNNSYLYATCSFVGCVVSLALGRAGIAQSTALVTGVMLTFLIRIVAVKFKIGLPV